MSRTTPTAASSDDELLVWADSLQQDGDPRGELVALQLAPHTKETNQRIADLLARYEATWLGAPLAAYLEPIGRVWERGFLVKAVLRTCEKDAIARVSGDPRLASLRTLVFHDTFRASASEVVPFLGTLPHLRDLEWVPAKVIDALLAAPPRHFDRFIARKAPRRWAPCAHFTPSTLGSMMDLGLPSIAELPATVTTYITRAADFASWMRRLPDAPRHLARLEFYSRQALPGFVHDVAFVVERGPSSRFDRVHITIGDRDVRSLVMNLRHVPTNAFNEITVEGTPSPEEAAALARLGWRAL